VDLLTLLEYNVVVDPWACEKCACGRLTVNKHKNGVVVGGMCAKCHRRWVWLALSDDGKMKTCIKHAPHCHPVAYRLWKK
jgi:hypothetical protein